MRNTKMWLFVKESLFLWGKRSRWIFQVHNWHILCVFIKMICWLQLALYPKGRPRASTIFTSKWTIIRFWRFTLLMPMDSLKCRPIWWKYIKISILNMTLCFPKLIFIIKMTDSIFIIRILVWRLGALKINRSNCLWWLSTALFSSRNRAADVWQNTSFSNCSVVKKLVEFLVVSDG